MKSKVFNFVAFDIGTSKIAAIAANISKLGEVKIISQVLHHSQGFKSGIITNLEAAQESIVNAVYTLEKECDKSIKEATISISGSGVKSFYLNHQIKLGNQPISKQDIKKLISKALSDFKVKDMEIIHYFPIEFMLDNANIVDNPIGMFAKELKCELHVIAANSLMLLNLTNCLAKCQIEVGGVVLSIYSSGLACLKKEEMELGCIIIEIGSTTTNFAVFFNNKIIYVGSVPVGSQHITADIAKLFSLSMDTAEKLKILYGNTITGLDKDNLIRIDEFEPESGYDNDLTITLGKLSSVIQPRVEEILLQVKEQYDRLKIDHLIAKKLVLTGGGACLQGLKHTAASVFQKQTRIAKPDILPGFAENYNPYTYASAIGAIKTKTLAYKNISSYSDNKDTDSWLKKTFLWLKENI